MGSADLLDRVRAPESAPLRLGLRNLYILPTRFGWLWLAGAALLQVVGIQLQRNGPLLLSFLLLGLFLLALHLTHFNLQGLVLDCGAPEAGFAGAALPYPIRLQVPGRCEGLRLRLGDGPLEPPRSFGPGEHQLALTWRPPARGRQRPGVVRLQTSAPLGLFLCWSRWRPPVEQLVWPAPVPGPVRHLPQGQQPARRDAAAGTPDPRREGSDDWQDLRPHRAEDPPGRLAWALVAQGRGKQVKVFADPGADELLLAPDPSVPHERALEHLSDRIRRLHGQGARYGLALPERLIPAATGTAQRDRCLAALALAR
ncbi:hypothetical protein NZK33_17195 [Cyanobium sp. FGCU-6]|jgi:uncharacterized protein (DUF58 family)|nr:hypothetical protein [Cyanobium sp. FGCU6]